MKKDRTEKWKIFNDFYKDGMWFWITIFVGFVLFCAILYLLAEYSIMWVN